MEALVYKWLPNKPIDTESMALALHLEKEYWRNMEISLINGYTKAMTGRT